jgi:Tol biopolymer transport system component
LVAAGFAAALPLIWFMRPTPEQPLLQLEISAPEGASLGQVGHGEIAVSPDGRAVVFPMIDGIGKRMLWVRALSASSATPLAGSDDGQRPFWSPDSRFVGFFARGKVYKADISGGPEQAICDWPKLVAGTWGPDGTILLGGIPGTSMPLHRVSSSGGTPAPIMPLDTSLDETSHRAPYFLPDGKRFLFATASKQPAIYLGSLDGKTRRLLFLHAQSTATYVPRGGGSGWILFGQGGRLMARPFDPSKGQLLGDPLPVADSLGGGLSWSASANGFLAFRALRDMTTELVWFDREGRSLGRVSPPGVRARFQGTRGSYPMLSPDEKLIAMARRDQGRDHLWVMDIERGITTRITPAEGTGVRSVWSRDGTSLFYSAPRRGPAILVKRADATGSEQIVAEVEVSRFPTDVSPDGRWLATDSNARDVVLMPLAGGKAITFSTDGMDASFSPDGRWIVYISETTGQLEIFVEPAPSAVGGPDNVRGRWQISTAGGTMPVWRDDGKELFYVSPDGTMMAAAVDSGHSYFRPGTPKRLFKTTLQFTNARRNYDVTRDGKRFLMEQVVTSRSEEPITIVMNWPKLLGR